MCGGGGGVGVRERLSHVVTNRRVVLFFLVRFL